MIMILTIIIIVMIIMIIVPARDSQGALKQGAPYTQLSTAARASRLEARIHMYDNVYIYIYIYIYMQNTNT